MGFRFRILGPGLVGFVMMLVGFYLGFGLRFLGFRQASRSRNSCKRKGVTREGPLQCLLGGPGYLNRKPDVGHRTRSDRYDYTVYNRDIIAVNTPRNHNS